MVVKLFLNVDYLILSYNFKQKIQFFEVLDVFKTIHFYFSKIIITIFLLKYFLIASFRTVNNACKWQQWFGIFYQVSELKAIFNKLVLFTYENSFFWFSYFNMDDSSKFQSLFFSRGSWHMYCTRAERM